MKHYPTVLICLIMLLAGWLIGRKSGGKKVEITAAKADTLTVHDTVRYSMPQPSQAEVIGTKDYVVSARMSHGGSPPRAEGDSSVYERDSVRGVCGGGDGGLARADSVTAELPIVQRHYVDSMYEAWVSGPLDPRLDSVTVYGSRYIIKARDRPSRWSIGVTCGTGLTMKGVQPYVGIGVSYALISF